MGKGLRNVRKLRSQSHWVSILKWSDFFRTEIELLNLTTRSKKTWFVCLVTIDIVTALGRQWLGEVLWLLDVFKWWRWWLSTSFLCRFCFLKALLMLFLECSWTLIQGAALLIILSTCCKHSAVLWISACHVCVLTGFNPYGTTQTWTKLNTTGCQEQDGVRQRGEHVKRPDGFFIWRRWLAQTIGASWRREQMWNEIILHNGSSGESCRKL